SVDAGTGQSLTIVCGAPNVRIGQRVPCARIGAVLPGGLEIRSATMRGVDSEGMLCSAKELGLSDDASGLLELPADAPAGPNLSESPALAARVLTRRLTPTRAGCLGVMGIGRARAAVTGAPFHERPIPAVPPSHQATFPVTLTDAAACGRFAGRVIRNVNA